MFYYLLILDLKEVDRMQRLKTIHDKYIRLKCPKCRSRVFEVYKANDSDVGLVCCKKCGFQILRANTAQKKEPTRCTACKFIYENDLKECPECLMGNPSKSPFVVSED